MYEKIVIGTATLYLGDCRDILPTLPPVDAIITDPPYSERTHNGHNAVVGNPTRNNVYRGKISNKITQHARSSLPYDALSPSDCATLAEMFNDACTGWIAWITDHTLAPIIAANLYAHGRYVFAPLPHYTPGRSVRLSGDGPNSWTDWIIVARTKAQLKWGTLPGGYLSMNGTADKAITGGKPIRLMESLVTDYSRPGQTVLDPFMGGGTTGIACARHGRPFIGVEIDRERFDLACRRIELAQRQRRLFDLDPNSKQYQQTDAYA